MSNKPKIKIDLMKGRIRIHGSALNALSNPEHILIVINPDTRALGIVPCGKGEQGAHKVVVHTQNRKKHFELYSIGLTRTIHQVWNELEDGGKYLIEGHLIEPSHILCFHVNDALKEEKE